MQLAALREALQDAAIYPELTTAVEVRETHISLVFLTDRYAYKVKKPVNLGFVDFSTLEQRRFYCEQELMLNRRLSSGVYLALVALYQGDEGYTFAPEGEIAEYALKMRRLPANRSLEVLLHRGAIPEETLSTLVQRLAVFHATHPLPAASTSYGTLEQIQADWQENFAQTQEYLGHSLPPQIYAHIHKAVNTFIARHAGWFAQRVQQERIRDCHGDLRAEHIYLEPGHMQIIDCIEFNERFRYIDVASEVAFLAVDLERLGASAMAHRFIQAYVEYSGDVPLYRLLDFYCCYRAYVRGKVTSLRLRETAAPEQQGQLQQQAEAYFRGAARYAGRLTRPLLLLTTGLIGSGKSTVAAGVAAALDLQLLISDRLRKELMGVSPETSQRATYGTALYSAEMIRRTYDTLAQKARQALSQGYSVILDASFSKQAERQRLALLAQEMGAECYVLECRAPEEVLRARLRERERLPATVSDAREEIFTPFQRQYEPVQAGELAPYVSLDTTQRVETCIQQALAAIQEKRL